jgi:hypothetical protein
MSTTWLETDGHKTSNIVFASQGWRSNLHDLDKPREGFTGKNQRGSPRRPATAGRNIYHKIFYHCNFVKNKL